jgi:hypothetical protein
LSAFTLRGAGYQTIEKETGNFVYLLTRPDRWVLQ